MIDIVKLRKSFPGHVAFNLALLLKGLRPVIQIDEEDNSHLTKILKLFPSMNYITHSMGTLLFFRVSSSTKAHLDTIRESRGKNIKKHVGDALKLVCSANDTSNADFRITLGVVDLDQEEWYFKAQMCTTTSQIKKVFEEMRRYESLAHEMGMIATTMKIVRVIPRMRTW